MTPDPKSQKRSIFAWCLFDWGNSAFGTVIITFVFSVYFARNIVGDEVIGSAWWSYGIAFSGLIIALLGPVLGAAADHYGARKPLLAMFSALCIVPTALLYFAVPDPAIGNVLLILGLLAVANVGFEMSLVFANAMLPQIAPKEMMGRISGWAWGMGYAGGLVCLVLTLFGLVGLGETEPWLSLPKEQYEHIRASAPLVAIWYLLFTIPLLLYSHDVARTGLSFAEATAKGLRQLRETAREVRHHANLVRFLIASAIYRDGMITLFAIGGLYAAGTFGMDFKEILIFAIGINLTAGLGAASFAFLDDHLGSKKTIMLSLAGLIVTGFLIVICQDKIVFLGLAMALGIFIGPAQSASRTLAARLSPGDMVAQTFGLYAFTGKSVSFLGPLAFGWATLTFDSQRAGLLSILLFWIVGMAVLSLVKEKDET